MGEDGPDPGGTPRPRLVDPRASVDAVERVHAGAAVQRPGMLHRDERWARRALFDPPEERRGHSELRCVLVEDGSGPRGYARYAVAEGWSARGPQGVVHVREAHALDPAAGTALWRYLLDLDLSATVELTSRPVDDPLLDLLVDVRAALPTLVPGLYLRVVDLDRALAQRAYARPLDVVLDVRDDLCPWNAGRWRLTGGPEGGACERTAAPADLALSVTELGAAYLGAASLARLGHAGRVEERTAGALAAASTAFLSDPQPWCPDDF